MTVEEFQADVESRAAELNPVYVDEVRKLSNLIPEARAPFAEGRLCRTNAYALCKKTPDRQRELLERAVTTRPEYFVPACV